MMAWATFRGGSLACLARTRARLVARSPCSGVFGRLHFEGGQGLKGQVARGPGPFGAGRDQVTNDFFDVHLYSAFSVFTRSRVAAEGVTLRW